MTLGYCYPEDKYLLIGTVSKAQGLQGEVAVHLFSGQPENVADYDSLVLVDKKGVLSPLLVIDSLRIHQGKAVIKFDRVVDRAFAEQVVGMGVLVDKEKLPDLGSDEFYWHQLTGLEVFSVQGNRLGIVKSLFSNGAQDIMVIRDNDHEYLVPVTASIVREQVDNRLIIDPPPGLLDINSEPD